MVTCGTSVNFRHKNYLVKWSLVLHTAQTALSLITRYVWDPQFNPDCLHPSWDFLALWTALLYAVAFICWHECVIQTFKGISDTQGYLMWVEEMQTNMKKRCLGSWDRAGCTTSVDCKDHSLYVGWKIQISTSHISKFIIRPGQTSKILVMSQIMPVPQNIRLSMST